MARILEERFHAPSDARCSQLLVSQSYLGALSSAAVIFLRAPRRALRVRYDCPTIQDLVAHGSHFTLVDLDDQV